MKAQSKNRKSPTCSRCRFHGERDVRVLQHKCPFKDCSCSDCLQVKKRANLYRAQKNLDKQDENSNEVSSPGSGSTGSSRCLGSPQIPMHPSNMGDSNEPNLQNSWPTNHQQPSQPPLSQQQQQQQQQHQHQQHQQPPVQPPPSSLVPPPPPHHLPPPSINSIPPNKNSGYSNIKNFQELCLTFPDHTPSQLQTLFEQCGNDYEKTIDKILMSKWYSESSASSNDYQSLTNDPNYSNNHGNNSNNNNTNNHNNINNNTNSNTNNNNTSNHNHNHSINNNSNNNHIKLEYPTNEDDTRLSFANCHYNQQQQQAPSQRMMSAPNFNNQDYTGDELVNRSIQPHNSDAMAPDWSYGDTTRYSTATSNYPNNINNTWNQGDYPAWSNASSNFWPSNGHTTYSYVDQNDANAMSYYYGRREMDYPEPSGHLDRTVRPEIGPNISSNYDFDSY